MTPKYVGKRSWPLFVLGALVLLFLGDVWLGEKTLLMRDFFFGDETNRLFVGRAIAHGQICTWTSLSQCGIPFSASPYTTSFYPPSWMFALPLKWALCLNWSFHFMVMAAGSYALARYWRFQQAPALLAAVTFAFSTFSVGWLEFGHGFYAMSWTAFVLLLVSRIIDQTASACSFASCRTPGQPSAFLQNAASAGGLAALLALQVVGSGEFFYYSCLLVALYVFMRVVWHGSWKVAGASVLWLGVAGALALGLAAPQIFTTMELMGLSIRSGEVDPMLAIASVHPRQWLAVLIPYLYGRPGYPDAYWAPDIFEFAAGHCYIGILPVCAAFFCGLRSSQDDPAARERRFLLWFLPTTVAVGAVMAAGKYTPVYSILHHWLPGFGHLRFPVKFLFFVTFALSMLGALGFQSLLISDGGNFSMASRRRWWAAAASFCAFTLIFLICLFNRESLVWLMAKPKPPTVEQVNAVRRDYSLAVLFAVTALGLYGALAFGKHRLRWLQAGVVAVAFLNLLVISRQAQPTGPVDIYARQPEALVKKIGGSPLYRFYSSYSNAQQYFYGECRTEMWEWVVDAGGTYHALQSGLATVSPAGMPLARYARFFGALTSSQPSLSEKLADMLSLRYVIGGAPFEQILWGNAPRDVRVGERKSCLPRVFAVAHWRSVQGAEPVLQTIAADSFDPRKEAIIEPLEGATIPDSPSVSGSGEAPGEVCSFVDRGNSVTMEVVAKNRVLLVLGDTWYPGWTATVDGAKSPIFQTNYLFRGVFVEPGTHRIEFSFWPTHLTAGLWCFALAAAGCVGLGVAAAFSTRSVRTRRSAASQRSSAPLIQ